MQENEKSQLCPQLDILDTSLVFLVLLIISVYLSWRATAIQREGLCRIIQGEGETMPDVSPIRLRAGAIVVGCLVFFFGLALDTWGESRCQDWAARVSADRNMWAALFVLAAALIRLYDLNWIRGRGAALEEEVLPD